MKLPDKGGAATLPAVVGTDINDAYDTYIADPTEDNYNEVFRLAGGLVNTYVKRFGSIGEFADLQQTGYIGVVKAIKSYSRSSGVKFSTWASTCIISEIRHEVRREQGALNLRPRSSDDNDSRGVVSLNNVDEKDISDNASERYDALEERIDLQRGLEQLDPVDRQILEMIFIKDYSQEEIARKLGLTQKKVSRKKNKLLEILRYKLDDSSFVLVKNEYSFKLIK